MRTFRTLLVALTLHLLASSARAQFSVEDFEVPTTGATSVALNGVTVNLTGSMGVRDGLPQLFGSGPSAKWIGNPLTSNPGLIGSIASATVGVGFEVKSVYVWTSANAGGTNASGPVTFTGVLPTGATVTETFTVTPTGFTGNDYIKVVFTPATWSGLTLSELRVSVGGTLNYVALDRFEYRALTLNPCLPAPCQNGGACSTVTSSTYSCSCLPGYTGAQCQTNINECAPMPCQNGGACVDLVNAYACNCPPGYSGAQCQTNINECAPMPCQNGGACVDGVNAYTCNCPPGYSGAQCQTNINECAPMPCQNGGICVDGVNAYTCNCAPGYSGAQCQTNINDCAPMPCQNGGICVDGVNAYTCTCAPGYSGAQCQTNIDECAPMPCQNGGTCADGVNTYTCSCAPGYSGNDCQTNVDDCASSPCLNGGTCADGVNTYTCSCAPGYSGTDCQTNVDDCASMPCLNGGTCADGVNTYSCDCTNTGYTGSNCESPLAIDDGGAPSDAGTASDAAAAIDAGTASDAGTGNDAGLGTTTPSVGCGCSIEGSRSSPRGSLLAAVIALAWSARRIRRRR